MKKMTKFILGFLLLAVAVCTYAGADTLTACGVPQFIVDALSMGSSGMSAAIILPFGETQTGIVIAYKNKKLIADQVMPIKMLDSNKLNFKYFERTKGDAFTVEDTKVGRTSEPNVINLGGTEKTDFCVARGLEDIIPVEDIRQLDNKERFTNTHFENLIGKVLLGREKAVAAMVQDVNNYGTGLSHTYGDSEGMGADGFDIVKVLFEYLDKPLARPNILGMGATAYHALRTNPKVLAAVYPNNQGNGVATKEQLCALFEVDQILVGEARVNTTKNAKNPVLERCWGNHIWGHYQEELTTLTEGIAWGITAQSGERYSSIVFDEKRGLEGSEILKAGMYQKEVVVGKDAGFLLKNVVKTTT